MDNEHSSGIKQILSQLGDEELWGLTRTVTGGLLQDKIQSREEALLAIINYSPDFKSILKRKVVTRELLFSYLHQNRIPVVMPISKDEIIGIICSHWNSKKTAQSRPATIQSVHHSSTVQQLQNDQSTQNDVIVQQSTQVQNVQQSGQLDVNFLALKFTEWFYSMLNSTEPIAHDHFWNDSKLKVNLLSPNGDSTEEIVYGPAVISQTLFKIKTEHNLYFNPNCLNDGVQGRVDPHGLVAVLACGTLHVNSVCVGVFEQVFMLARDPFLENNWKIKTTELNLRSKENVQGPPKLCDSSLTNALM
uniref:NTF2 domain-containing protein n=1 Tax=Photinus pyralis TaxID=7054 RepID=A0A1Y1LRJ9_PHOPY